MEHSIDVKNKYIAVLITVHNRRAQTMLCLDNLFHIDLPKHILLDVFLTNDGCTDGTPEEVRQKYPQVIIIDGDGTLFWNRGMWNAWDKASNSKDYDYYLWLNDDTLLFDDCINVLYNSSLSQNNEAIIVGATVSSENNEKVTYGGRVGRKIAPLAGYLSEIDHFNGNIVLIPKIVFKILGNLDYYYTHSKGDFDYGIRARKKGIKMYQAGSALGICDLHKRIDKWCDPEIPLVERWRFMHKPNGMPPKESFHFDKKTSLLVAVKNYFTIHLRCLFPSLWLLLGKAKLTEG